MASWNPNSTGTKGLEFAPHSEGLIALDSPGAMACMSLQQTAADVTGAARVWVGAVNVRGGTYVLDVFDGETAVPANLTQIDYRPNEDVTGVAVANYSWREDDGTTIVAIYDQIDEASWDPADYIFTTAPGFTPPGTIARYEFRVASTAALTGKRILGVVVNAFVGQVAAGGTWKVGLNIAGTRYMGPAIPADVRPTGGAQAIQGTWLYNPAQNRPWRIADVQTFDSTDEIVIEATIASSGIPVASIDQAWVTVIYCDENRLASGTMVDTGAGLTADAWNEITLTTPTGGAWTKDSTGYHLYLLRRLSSAGSLVVPSFTADAQAPPARRYEPALDSVYGYLGVIGSMGDPMPSVFPLFTRTTAPADSVDGQPYVTPLVATVITGQDAEGEFSNAAATVYGIVKALVAHGGAPTADLLVKVKRRSDNLQFGSTITITKAEIDALPEVGTSSPGTGWRAWEGRMASTATLATGTQYYIEFSSAATGVGSDQWLVCVLDTGNQGNGASFGGTTDRAVYNGTEADRYDLVATLLTVPTAPANFATAVASQALANDGSSCAVPTLQYVTASWSATSLSGSFSRYEIERSDDAGVTWVRVAELGTEATVTWADYGAKRGVEASYRIRVVRSDGAQSDWSTVSAATKESPDAAGCEWAFTSQEDPSLNVAINANGPEVEYEFFDADDVTFTEIYGRDYRVAESGTEHRGVRFTIPVIVQTDQTPTVEGVGVFDRLRDLMEADIDHVCILDHLGNRFLGDVRVPRGLQNNLTRFYVSEIIVTETTDTPVVDTA